MKSTPDERETFRKKQTGKDFSKIEVVRWVGGGGGEKGHSEPLSGNK